MNGQCYRFDPDTKQYIGPDQAQESPLEPGVWLWPANTTAISPPADVAGSTINFIGGSWTYQQVPVPPAPTLADVKKAQIDILNAAYNTAIQQPVAYMSTTFQADTSSQTKVMAVLAAMTPAGATPAGFYWVDMPNNRVPMTLAQVQGLAQAMMAQGWTAFQNLQTRKASVNAATTIQGVQAVVW